MPRKPKTLDPGLRRGDVGFFNPAHPRAVQVLGEAGAEFLSKLQPATRKVLPRKLARAGMQSLIVARGASVDAEPWTAAGVACETRDEPAHEIVHALRCGFARENAARQTVHGALMLVYGAGVLVEGAAGAGKSQLALDLIGRGHSLIADDAVELSRPTSGILLGRSPAVLEGYLASRDLGVVDVLRMHGRRAVRKQCRLDLVVKLVAGLRAPTASQLLAGRRTTRRLLGESIPSLSLPAQTGHNLSSLVEAACLDQRLRLDGIEADAALARRQAGAIRKR